MEWVWVLGFYEAKDHSKAMSQTIAATSVHLGGSSTASAATCILQ
jgi:hypothetical protein